MSRTIRNIPTKHANGQSKRTIIERLQKLDDIGDMLESERNFGLNEKDWQRVYVAKQNLKRHAEQKAKVLRLFAQAED